MATGTRNPLPTALGLAAIGVAVTGGCLTPVDTLQTLEIESRTTLPVVRPGGMQTFAVPDWCRADLLVVERAPDGLAARLRFVSPMPASTSGDLAVEAVFSGDDDRPIAAAYVQLAGRSSDPLIAKALGDGETLVWAKGRGVIGGPLLRRDKEVVIPVPSGAEASRIVRLAVSYRPAGVSPSESESPLDWLVASWVAPRRTRASALPTFGSLAREDLAARSR